MEIHVKNTGGLAAAAQQLLEFAGDKKVFLFEGDMGAGKTTFIKSLCEQLGSADVVSSPTFSIVNEYDYPEGLIYHFDFYRLKSEAEAYDLGYEDYFYSGNYCFIEWPSKVENLWPGNALMVNIRVTGENKREISANLIPHP
ncbi:MAG TPA: tRNA (adenosine(37)-N6)-threonylcarbamoyltransferase complex ATPase subunit type 1 TsaE [Sphingobacteriaceae bacterium]